MQSVVAEERDRNPIYTFERYQDDLSRFPDYHRNHFSRRIPRTNTFRLLEPVGYQAPRPVQAPIPIQALRPVQAPIPIQPLSPIQSLSPIQAPRPPVQRNTVGLSEYGTRMDTTQITENIDNDLSIYNYQKIKDYKGNDYIDDNQEYSIEQYLEKDENNIVFLFKPPVQHNEQPLFIYFTTINALTIVINNRVNIKYNCVGDIPEPNLQDPLISLRSIGVLSGGYVKVKQLETIIRNPSNHRILRLMKPEEFKSFATTTRDCQNMDADKIYRLFNVRMPETIGGSKKTRTRKTKKTKKTKRTKKTKKTRT